MNRRSAKDRQQAALDFSNATPNAWKFQETGVDIDFDFRRDLREAMAAAGISRATIAARMTDILFPNGDGEVTRTQLDFWAAQSKDSWRMPATHLAAFVSVTESHWILEKLARRCGCLIIRGEEAALVELGRLIAKRQQIDARERALLKDLPQNLVEAVMRDPKVRR